MPRPRKYANEEAYRAAQREQDRERRRLYREKGRRVSLKNRIVESVHAPPELLAERDRVLALPRTLSMELFGDPPPGFSALDRMRASP